MEPCVSETEEGVKSSPRAERLLGWTAWLRKYWTNLSVVALAILLWLPRFSGPIDLRWDAGIIIFWTSLAGGKGYRIPSEPGSPEAVQYPPLLPAFVAAHQRLSGTANPEDVAPRLRLSYALMFLPSRASNPCPSETLPRELARRSCHCALSSTSLNNFSFRSTVRRITLRARSVWRLLWSLYRRGLEDLRCAKLLRLCSPQWDFF